MAIIEERLRMTVPDSNGDDHVMYPETKIPYVDGLSSRLSALVNGVPYIDANGCLIMQSFSAYPITRTVTLTAAGWANNQQTVTVNGVDADESRQLIQPCPAAASQSAYDAGNVTCIAQAANSLTFSCDDGKVPSADLTIFVIITEVSNA